MEKNEKRNYGFPVELLNDDKEARKVYFNNYIASHRALKKAVDETISVLTSPISERLIFVCGPSGVGKKVLVKEITQKLIDINANEVENNPGCIPVVNVEAIAPEQGNFSFSNLWRQALINLNEPMLNSKILYSVENHINLYGEITSYSKMRKADFLDVLVNALINRDVKAMIINEAHHLLRVSSGKKANWSLDLLKSLTNCSNTPILLVGTYSLCAFLEDFDNTITDQINQRTKVIDFPRYHQNNAEEVNAFSKTAKKLLLSMPFEQSPESLVDSNWEYLYKYSLGCIGTLKNWFTDAYSYALEVEAKTLDINHLDKTKISGKRLSYMFDSIKDGEKRLKNILSDGDLNAKLEAEIQIINPQDTKKNNSVNAKPFERSPKRDAVIIR